MRKPVYKQYQSYVVESLLSSKKEVPMYRREYVMEYVRKHLGVAEADVFSPAKN